MTANLRRVKRKKKKGSCGKGAACTCFKKKVRYKKRRKGYAKAAIRAIIRNIATKKPPYLNKKP